MSVFCNVIKPQGLEPFQFSTKISSPSDHTFNPWAGCQKVSDGCKFCYAERLVGPSLWGPEGQRRGHSDVYWQKPDRWHEQALREGRRIRVFCGSICDVFEDWPDVVRHRERLWGVVARTTALDWQLLTKRPQNISRMVPPGWMEQQWPDHVWIGTSTEDQERAVHRAAELVQIPAQIRFLSVEPLLEPIPNLPLDGIRWVIVGGESGSQRAMDLAWARDVRDQCANAGVPFFMKQLGGRWDKQDALHRMPEDLRIRQFPSGNTREVEAA